MVGDFVRSKTVQTINAEVWSKITCYNLIWAIRGEHGFWAKTLKASKRRLILWKKAIFWMFFFYVVHQKIRRKGKLRVSYVKLRSSSKQNLNHWKQRLQCICQEYLSKALRRHVVESLQRLKTPKFLFFFKLICSKKKEASSSIIIFVF